MVLVKVKETGSISIMYRICTNEGFDDVKIHYVGGLWVWIQFNNVKTCEAFKSNKALQNIWSTTRVASPSFKVDERMVWIKITGLLLCAKSGNDSEGCQKDDDRSRNMEEKHNDVLDDFIKQVVEQKVLPKSTNDVQKENNGVNLDGSDDISSKPLGFESFIKKDVSPFLNSKEVEEKRENINIVNVKSGGKWWSRSAKCSTSFGNFKSKDRNGFSFIDEINRMIKVGGVLAYDVKGCKRSLRKMINRIGVSMVDK
uniref:RNA-directed DNA polymerase, eukaryota, reverse transcriptase zinc-binding domain protein n=1 Tax=Tanacetum cinerariifolium TaxID=118510 RepID=A0A6L2LVM8_TANCI|nr:RNA-directed DNA polymerase, eukaryota, reverse transcriptase zinc-binding domain protein [Tanacetum cinerariifolium]